MVGLSWCNRVSDRLAFALQSIEQFSIHCARVLNLISACRGDQNDLLSTRHFSGISIMMLIPMRDNVMQNENENRAKKIRQLTNMNASDTMQLIKHYNVTENHQLRGTPGYKSKQVVRLHIVTENHQLRGTPGYKS
jgi:uncharacterized transporter YbjL